MEELYDQKQIFIANENRAYNVKINKEFWKELFELEKGIEKIESDERHILEFLNKYIIVEGYSSSSKQLLDLDDWGPFITKKNEWIESLLKKYFTEGEYSIENEVLFN